MDNVNIGPKVLVANWTEAGIATVVVCIRMFTQIKVVGRVGIDDYLILLALATGLINTSLITAAIHWGIGRHIQYLEPAHIVTAIRFEFLAQPWGILAPTFARVSFSFYLMKFIGQSKPMKWALWQVIVVQTLSNLVTIILILVQCQHLASLWNPSVKGHCWSPRIQVNSGYAQGVINTFHDLLLTFLPLFIMKDLRMKLRVKIILVILMSMSIFVCVASVIKTIALGNLGKRADFTYDTTFFIIWFTIENYVSIIAASVPSLRPLFLSFTRKPTTLDNSYEMRNGGQRSGYLRHPNSRMSKSWAASHTATHKETIAHSGDGSSEEDILAAQPYNGITKTTNVMIQYGSENKISGIERTDMDEEMYHGTLK